VLFLLVTKVKALDNIPNNIYYFDSGVYAYLSNEELAENLFIEYSLNNGTEEKLLEKIEVKELNQKILLLEENDDFLTDILSLKVKARYVSEEESSDWSIEKRITNFDFKDMPAPEIANFKVGDGVIYEVTNQGEINNYFGDYTKIFGYKVEYKEEYRINEGDWVTKLAAVDLNDVKIEFRVYYKIANFESVKSNILTYEKHPTENICLFGTDFCCNQIFNISVCIWIFVLFILLVSILIFIDNKKRINKEA